MNGRFFSRISIELFCSTRSHLQQANPVKRGSGLGSNFYDLIFCRTAV